jgi:hypothetical protein
VFLSEHPEEAATVYEDLLIHVTEFFRDENVLEKAIATVVETCQKPRDEPIRVWIPGCSTGEEVYSLAILLLERLGMNRALQLFGTDLSERAIETARVGRYPATIAARIGPERLARFFQHDDSGYRIRREVRERCVFARHDLVTDPPFSRLDLVSCRNAHLPRRPPATRCRPALRAEQPGVLGRGDRGRVRPPVQPANAGRGSDAQAGAADQPTFCSPVSSGERREPTACARPRCCASGSPLAREVWPRASCRRQPRRGPVSRLHRPFLEARRACREQRAADGA